MMVINNNIPALTTYGIVNNTSNALQKSIQKLSTGLRINSAADDAAGLSISEKMRAQINGLDRAVSNAQDGVSLIQTAEGALTETHSILQRMRELSVQAANDTLTQQDRSYIQEEVDLLRDEIDHIGNTTTFNTKKLLNGDAAVLWSSDKLSTKAIVNGGLREVDQFGQKKSFEGNYNISITADPGTAEVQKSDIFKVKHTNAGINAKIDSSVKDKVTSLSAGANSSGGVTKMGENPAQYDISDGITYTVKNTGAAVTATDALAVTASHTTNSNSFLKTIASTFDGTLGNGTWELAFEVKDITKATSGTDQSVATIAVKGFKTALDGTVTAIDQTMEIKSASFDTSTTDASINYDTVNATAVYTNIGNSGITFNSTALAAASTPLTAAALNTLSKGDTALITGSAGTSDAGLQVDYTGLDGKSHTHTVGVTKASALGENKDATIAYVNFNEKTGEYSLEKINFHTETTANGYTNTDLDGKTIGTIKHYEIGDVAQDNVRLRDLDKFWDSQGNFMIEDPQTITINQGNGKTASVTLYAYDTLGDVADKLNDAIANQLGQKEYIDTSDEDAVNNFVNFVNDGTDNTAESVEGTFVIRSAVAGKDGTLRFASKNEDLINALSLNTLQNSTETVYTVNIEDAHTGESIVSGEKITGNKLMGKLHENIDVEFDPMTGITSTWDDDNKKFTAKGVKQDTVLHLADNTMTFQIGANEGDDMGINIGDMRSHALGLDSVLVTDRDSASRSITIIDSAIDKVSTQRAKLGAYQNRLEHTMTNLSTSAENLTASESRIRDTDMAKEMMNFTKLQIMLQAGNSMLAQANQLPQNVLSLIR